ncbi:FAD-dependent monooxygenase [Dactylosporangium salmoneum]|uniref:FAD-dependent monooxygenase n=1 Tax=Dactylosporangium salmoneum TaxID=53361 RepID=A0ABP5UK33_9ACTN
MDVVVAGAGPVGLMLASELALAGVRVTVLERRTEIDLTIKAGSLNSPTIEALDRRGLTPALQEAAAANLKAFAKAPAGKRFAGHFGGLMIDADRLDRSDPELAAAARLGALAVVSQQQLETILEKRARELGVDLRRGVELTGFTDDGDEVELATDQGPLTTSWLVGCDGGRSLVRKHAGFEFPGTSPEITAYQAMADMEGTEGLPGGWHATDTGVYVLGPMPGRVLVVEFREGDPRKGKVTEEELEGAIRRVTGADVRVTGIRTATRFTDNARQATMYRKGRVLLAGDAAHVHSPFGGQGLNLGIGDAMNLGWKLAAVAQGRASQRLLDTYTAERHPIGAWVLDWTRAQIAVMRPDPHARALRAVLADLANTTDGATYLATRLSGVWQGYDLPGGHPLTGRPAPELELSDGRRLAEHLHDGKALLINTKLDGCPHAVAAGAPRMLVRPDGYVAWASDDEEIDEAAYLCAMTAA